VPAKVPVAKFVVAGMVVLVAGFSAPEGIGAEGTAGAAEVWQVGVAVAVAIGVAAWAARDLVAPVRLAADQAGLTLVTGFARRHRLGWRQVDRVRVDVRRRSRMLEVDSGETLYLFSRYDLDADLDEVAAHLESLRREAVS
jgi:hypothetical protein